MKKILMGTLGSLLISILLWFVITLTFVGCGTADMSKVKIDYGVSSIYTEEDMNAAIAVIRKKFSTFKGCELHSLSYSSDEESTNADNISWMNNLEKANDNKEVFSQCIAFNSSFRSPKKGDSALVPNEEYTWTWWLARSEGGEWKLMTWGY